MLPSTRDSDMDGEKEGMRMVRVQAHTGEGTGIISYQGLKTLFRDANTVVMTRL